jgi:vacuolar-type H+-ATPase subunit H
MNRHFEDTQYYLKRAGETAKKGIAEELEPIEERVREDLKELQERTEGEAEEAIVEARERLRELRTS